MCLLERLFLASIRLLTGPFANNWQEECRSSALRYSSSRPLALRRAELCDLLEFSQELANAEGAELHFSSLAIGRAESHLLLVAMEGEKSRYTVGGLLGSRWQSTSQAVKQ